MKILITLLALIAFILPTHAQTTLIIPFPAGGSFDVMGRKLAPYLEKELQEKVNVINIAGAGGTIAVAKLDNSNKNTLLLAGPWFYTMLLSNNQPSSKYKYPGMIGEAFLYLAVSKKSGLTCDKIRETQTTVFIGSNGPKTMASYAVEIVKEKYNNVTEVPYKGGSSQVMDIISGELTGTFLLSKGTNRSEFYNIIANTSASTVDGIPSWKDCLGITKTLNNQYFMIANSLADDSYIVSVNNAIRTFVKDPEAKSYFHDEGIYTKNYDIPTNIKEIEKGLTVWRTR